jgi:hypothetical protein
VAAGWPVDMQPVTLYRGGQISVFLYFFDTQNYNTLIFIYRENPY